MILGSHNSWTYLKPKKWWMKLIGFTAKCQKYGIKTQYEKYGVRCFDLRVKMEDGEVVIAHGPVQYKCLGKDLYETLEYLNNKGDVYLRVLHEVRKKKEYTTERVEWFKSFCSILEEDFKSLKCWCGRNLYNWNVDYQFKYEPSCEEKYSSVCPPKYLDDWIPIIYACLHNKKNIKEGTDKDILLIDFVNIQ